MEDTLTVTRIGRTDGCERRCRAALVGGQSVKSSGYSTIVER